MQINKFEMTHHGINNAGNGQASDILRGRGETRMRRVSSARCRR